MFSCRQVPRILDHEGERGRPEPASRIARPGLRPEEALPRKRSATDAELPANHLIFNESGGTLPLPIPDGMP